MGSVDVDVERIGDCLMVREAPRNGSDLDLRGHYSVSMRCGHEVFERCVACRNQERSIRASDDTLEHVATVRAASLADARRWTAEYLRRHGWTAGGDLALASRILTCAVFADGCVLQPGELVLWQDAPARSVVEVVGSRRAEFSPPSLGLATYYYRHGDRGVVAGRPAAWCTSFGVPMAGWFWLAQPELDMIVKIIAINVNTAADLP